MAQSYCGFRGRDMTQALLKISFRSRYTSDRSGNSVGDSDSDRRKQKRTRAGWVTGSTPSQNFPWRPVYVRTIFFKACDTPEWEVTEQSWELECYGCPACAESSREFGRLPTRTDGRRVRGPDVVLAMGVAIWWAMPLSIRHHVVSSGGDEDRPGSWSVQGLEATDHYPHSRGTISRVVPQGLGESAQAAWAPPGGLKDQTLGLAPCT